MDFFQFLTLIIIKFFHYYSITIAGCEQLQRLPRLQSIMRPETNLAFRALNDFSHELPIALGFGGFAILPGSAFRTE